MRRFALSELEQPLAAARSGADCQFESVSIDSRTTAPGALFVALSGEQFDGHRFVPDAAARGATAALVSAADKAPLPVLRVADTRRALGQLGACNRTAFNGTVVAVTGSSGKTTVKNMLAQIFAQSAATLATQGNFNNEIGLPLTLLQLQPQHAYAVLEMGAARAGDIDYLCRLARPAITLLLNALPAHLQGFGSLAGVARGKGEILGHGDTVVFSADSEFTPLWRELAGAARRLEFGWAAGADLRASAVQQEAPGGSRFVLVTPAGTAAVQLSLPGRHNISNALAAAAAAFAAGIGPGQIAAGLSAVTAAPGRLKPLRAHNGATLLDDSYNANPGSVRAAIDLLADCAGRRWLVLGAMAELGADTARLHAEIGAYAAQKNIDRLLATGAGARPAVAAFGPGGDFFEHRDEVLALLRTDLAGTDVVLVKGSRDAGMEQLVAALVGPTDAED